MMQLSLKHRVRRGDPAGPILVLLHGVGSNEDDLFALAPYLDPRLTIVAARAPLAHPPGYGWYPVAFRPEGIVFDESVALESFQTLVLFLDECCTAYGCDPKQLYLGGFSQGAAMSLLTLLRRPELLAGAALLSGRLIPRGWELRAPDASFVGKPVYCAHGTYDPVLPISQGHAIRDSLAALPVALTYNEYPMAHTISSESLADFAAWLTECLNSG